MLEPRNDPGGITDRLPRVSRRRQPGQILTCKEESGRNSPFPFCCHKFCSELGLLYPEAIFRKAGRVGKGRKGRMLGCSMIPEGSQNVAPRKPKATRGVKAVQSDPTPLESQRIGMCNRRDTLDPQKRPSEMSEV